MKSKRFDKIPGKPDMHIASHTNSTTESTYL